MIDQKNSCIQFINEDSDLIDYEETIFQPLKENLEKVDL